MGGALTVVLAVICAAVWVYLILARGGFWRGRVRDTSTPVPSVSWPRVTAIVPARDESGVIAASLRSLLQQEYLGHFSIIVVDDDSRDGTTAVAKGTATSGPARALTVIA